MSVNLEITVKKSSKTYFEGECVSGLVVISTPADVKHDGITLTLEGIVSLQVSNKNAGMFEAFRNPMKPITLINCSVDLQEPGKIPSGVTEIPFEFPLTVRERGKASTPALLETYHGVFVSVNYCLRCVMKRSFLNNNLQNTLKFLVQYRKSKDKIEPKPVKCVIGPHTIQKNRSLLSQAFMPFFNILIELDSTVCSLEKPFTGQITVKECAVPIKSIEIQLVRVETCGSVDGYARDATEIQNIQIGEGDVCRNVPIPIYMLFPRLFTCPTTLTTSFKIEFEINVAIILQDDHLITENFGIILTRN